jgi:hypothetical protein
MTEKILASISNRFRTVLTVAILFPTLMGAFGKTSYSLDWAYAIGFYLLSYVIYEAINFRIGHYWLLWINNFLLAGIAVYILPIFVITWSKDWIPLWAVYSFLISIGYMFWLPVFILIFILASPFLPSSPFGQTPRSTLK